MEGGAVEKNSDITPIGNLTNALSLNFVLKLMMGK
jgi:hypothetical protein